ncbi:predicted E3 ubiquitin ligase [Moesziomyces antarcticus T-34]|uniref:Predicted E3 ubiquitin ligase n=1 Tax=Pseudozyma antarctica (strain T-34) TaxID=1151754 RepID=M9LZ48_PSEA3|nr:predicted E3 ubiquitin ligase [Moesziomyces antarcticus T-34]
MARNRRRDRRSALSLQRVATLSLVALSATLPTVHAATQPKDSGAAVPQPSLNPTASIAQAVSRTRRPWFSAAKDRVVDSVSRFLSHALPDPRYFSYDLDQFDEDQMPYDDGLPLDSGSILDGPGLNWGGSTLEVVRSQAIFLTRSAAFGPRVTDDLGLKGFLLPISDFYKVPKDAAFFTSDASGDPIHACPYKGGPGSKRDVLHHKYEDEDDRRLYSAFYPDSQVQAPFTWTHEAEGGPEGSLKPPHNWIALVQRGGGCGFADKVRVAQELGAIAVVVGDAPSPSWHGGRSGDPNEEGDPGLSGKRLITMFAPGDTSDVHIPSTFVTRPSYLDLERLIQETEKDQDDWQRQHPSQHGPDGAPATRGLEIVISKDDLVWEWPLIDFGILLLLLPSFMTVITIIVHRIRMVRQRRKERAPELVVLGLPCLIWRGNGQPWEKVEGADVDPGPGNGGSDDAATSRPFAADDLESGRAGETIPLLAEDENGAGPSQRTAAVETRPVNPASVLPPGRTYFSTDECAICLCDFVDGDRVRVLPCGHIFHRQEVDDWLVRVKKLCPICKRDITVPIPPAPPVGVATAVSSPAAFDEAAGEPRQAEGVAATPENPADESIDLSQHLAQDHGHDQPSNGRQV